MFALDRVVPFNGRSFPISPRLVHRVKRWDRQADLLWPSVPSNYFVSLSQKTSPDKIRVTYLGRVDLGKGAQEAIEILDALADSPEVQIAFYGIHWESDPIAERLHRQLLQQSRFYYVPVKWIEYSDDVEEMVRSALQDTDILIQPYRRLSSTIDTPVILLEAMASLCAVITRPHGDISNIYGASPCLIDQPELTKKAIKLILSAKEWLPQERERIEYQRGSLHFDTPAVARHFINALSERDGCGVSL
ncbi:glycosyltransferase [Chloroflexota bacterium]